MHVFMLAGFWTKTLFGGQNFPCIHARPVVCGGCLCVNASKDLSPNHRSDIIFNIPVNHVVKMEDVDAFVAAKFQPYRMDRPKLPREIVIAMQFSPVPVSQVPSKRARLDMHRANGLAFLRLGFKDSQETIAAKLKALPGPYDVPLSLASVVQRSINEEGTPTVVLSPTNSAGFTYRELCEQYKGVFYVWPTAAVM